MRRTAIESPGAATAVPLRRKTDCAVHLDIPGCRSPTAPDATYICHPDERRGIASEAHSETTVGNRARLPPRPAPRSVCSKVCVLLGLCALWPVCSLACVLFGLCAPWTVCSLACVLFGWAGDLPLPQGMKGHRCGCCHVERVDAGGHRDRCRHICGGQRRLRQTWSFSAQQQCRPCQFTRSMSR